MKKILGLLLNPIKKLLTKTSLPADPKTILSLKAAHPEDLLEPAADLFQPPRPEIPGAGQTWENTLGNVVVHPELAFAPTTISQLQDIIAQAEAGNHKIKAVGSGHSFSDVAPTNDYLIFTHQLNQPLVIDHSLLTDNAKNLKLFETQSGITLHDLNQVLDNQHLALSTMGSFDAQTIIGAISTGTHGTGLQPGSVSGMVRSIVLVSSGRKVFRIEPSVGISDPRKFNSPDIQLLQDDTTFYSVLVSMGCMGIIYSLIIEVMDSYWLDENRQLSSWEVIKPDLVEGSIINENRHFEVQVNPYSSMGQHSCLVLKQNIIPDPGSIPEQQGHRNYFTALLDLIPFAPEALRLYLNTFPKKIPGAIDSALKKLVDRKDYINKSFEILNMGLPNFKRIGYACEFAFPLKDNKYIEAVEKIFDVAAEQQKNNKYIDSPLSLRFAKASPALVSMDCGKDTCFIDIPSLFGGNYSDQMLDIMQDAMIVLGGRPHWGKINNRQPDIIKKFYPRFGDWIAIKNKLDPNNIFSNDFSNRFGL